MVQRRGAFRFQRGSRASHKGPKPQGGIFYGSYCTMVVPCSIPFDSAGISEIPHAECVIHITHALEIRNYDT